MGNFFVDKVSGTLEIVPPFSLYRSARFLEMFRPMKEEQEVIDGSIAKAIMVNGQDILFKIKQKGNGDSDPVEYDLISNEPLAKTVCESVTHRISFFLSLKEDVIPFYEIARKEDPKFYPVVERFWGFHHVKFLTLLEAATWAILAQRAPLSLAKKMKRRLIERFGWSIEVDGKRFWAFPDYSRVKNTSTKELYPIISNKKRAESLGSLFRDYEKIDEGSLLKLDFDEAKKVLMQINGIGDWSATFILSRGLGRMERLPKNIKTIMPEAHQIYGSELSIERINAIYGKWAGYWLLYLWASHLTNQK
jgi:DNA-3-methyladenine glycosylase II